MLVILIVNIQHEAMKKEACIIFLLVFWSGFVCGQQKTIDTLLIALKNAPQQTNNRLDILNNLCIYLVNKNQFLTYNIEAIKLAKQLKSDIHLARAYKLKGTYHMKQGKYAKAISLFKQSLKIAKAKNGQILISSNLERLGITYRKQGRLVKALQSYEAALEILLKMNASNRISNIYSNIGVLYASQKKYAKAIEFYHKSLKLYSPGKKRKRSYIPILNNNIGVAWYYQKNYVQALVFYQKSLALHQLFGNRKSAIVVTGNIALVKGKQKKYATAISQLHIVIDSLNHWHAKYPQALFLQELGKLYQETNRFNKAKLSFNKALNLAKKIHTPQRLMDVLEALYSLHKSHGEFRTALKYLEKLHSIKDSVFNHKYDTQIATLETNLQLTEKEQRNQLQASKLREKDIQLNRQYTIITGIAGMLLLVLAIALLFYRQRRQKQKTNQELHEKNEEIQTASEELQASHEKIEEINKSITASITYAQRIQKAILPSYNDIQQAFPESFIFYKPRDIISGDFYWFTQTDSIPVYKENNGFDAGKILKGFSNEKQIIVVGDCTGHGVPGAFMTMLCTQALSNIVVQNYIQEPGEVLQYLDIYLKKALRSEQTKVKDGMDMTICVIDHAEKTLTFAGAKNSLIYWQKSTIKEIKGSTFSINNYARETYRFESHTIDITSPITFYMYSDGYQDQFGGPDGKKFMKKRFRELLGSITRQSVAQQKEILETTLSEWMGDKEQVDDILIMGVKLTG